MAIRQEPEEDFYRIDIEDAQKLIASGDVDIVDVREPWEYEQGHIPNARLVPLNTLLSSPQAHLKRDNILMVCGVGQRSAVAAEMAAALGYTRVYNLEGGTTGWIQHGLPVEK
jgi:adenylyltransferase/sulfurtransferase